MKFSSFLDIKNKKTIRELEILKDLLSKDFKIESFLHLDKPYLYLKSNRNDLSFDGVRIYKVGSNMAYRIQNENESEPYGQAYPLNLEEMFQDLIPDMSEDEAGELIANALVEEFNNFFKKSSDLQDELQKGQFSKNDMSSAVVVVGSNSGDFTNSV